MKARKHSNSLSSLMIGDKLEDDTDVIEQHIINHFIRLFAELSSSKPTLHGLEFTKISKFQSEWPIGPSESPKVEALLNNLAEDKAPGIDGFPMGVIKKSWHFMKSDIMSLLQEFHKSRNLDWRLYSTLLALRPSSLVSCLHKG